MCVYVDTYTHVYTHTCGLPRCLSGKESACQRRRCRFHPWVGKIPWRRKWQPSPVFLPGESHGQRSLGGYSPLESESQTHLSNWVHTCACVDVHTHTHTHTYICKKIKWEQIPPSRMCGDQEIPHTIRRPHTCMGPAVRPGVGAPGCGELSPEFQALLLSLPCPSPPVAPFTLLRAGPFCSLSFPSHNCRPEASEWLSSFGARLSRLRVT